MKGYRLFATLMFLTISLSFISKELLYSDELIIYSYSDLLTQEQLMGYLSLQKKWQWVGFGILPIILFIKISIIAVVLDIGSFFFGKEIKYKNLFNIVVKAEFIFLLIIVFKTIWFYFFETNYNLQDLQYFYPLSALNLIGYDGLKHWFIYPLQVLNLFELVYWILLAFLIDRELGVNKSKDLGIQIVASSYGVGLLIWVVGVMFFTLNIS